MTTADAVSAARWSAELDEAIREARAAGPALEELHRALVAERDAILQAAAVWQGMEEARRGRMRMFYPVD